MLCEDEEDDDENENENDENDGDDNDDPVGGVESAAATTTTGVSDEDDSDSGTPTPDVDSGDDVVVTADENVRGHAPEIEKKDGWLYWFYLPGTREFKDHKYPIGLGWAEHFEANGNTVQVRWYQAKFKPRKNGGYPKSNPVEFHRFWTFTSPQQKKTKGKKRVPGQSRWHSDEMNWHDLAGFPISPLVQSKAAAISRHWEQEGHGISVYEKFTFSAIEMYALAQFCTNHGLVNQGWLEIDRRGRGSAS